MYLIIKRKLIRLAVIIALFDDEKFKVIDV